MEYDIYGARLRAPLVSAHSRTDVRSLVRVRLVAEDGFVGVGEAAPLESYDGVSVQDVVAALDAWRPGGPLPLLPQAAAAIEMALWDLEGRRAGKRTLAVRLGPDRSRILFAAIVYASYPLALGVWLFGPARAWLLLPFLTLPLAVPLVRLVRNHADGASLNQALAGTGQLQLAFCVLLSAGLLLSR